MNQFYLLLLVIFLAGAGTYLIRVLPMKWQERQRNVKTTGRASGSYVPALQAIGPAAIVALLTVSVADMVSAEHWLKDILNLLLGVSGVWLGHRVGGIALGTLLGVLLYGLGVAYL